MLLTNIAGIKRNLKVMIERDIWGARFHHMGSAGLGCKSLFVRLPWKWAQTDSEERRDNIFLKKTVIRLELSLIGNIPRWLLWWELFPNLGYAAILPIPSCAAKNCLTTVNEQFLKVLVVHDSLKTGEELGWKFCRLRWPLPQTEVELSGWTQFTAMQRQSTVHGTRIHPHGDIRTRCTIESNKTIDDVVLPFFCPVITHYIYYV